MGRRGDRETGLNVSPSPRRPVSPSETWRVFCAVELPDHLKLRLEDHVRRLRDAVPDVAASWTRVENIHLTLKFFGNVAVERIQAISDAVSRAVNETTAFQIGVGASGVFPKPSRPQVLWIGVNDQSGKLVALQKRVEEECAKVGFEKEDRTYKPHLTIARIRRPDGARRLADAHLEMGFEPVEIQLNELIVFRSELSSKGSQYTAVSRLEFKL